MLNPFVIKKWGALMLSGLLTTIMFFVGLQFFNFIYALMFMGLGVVLSSLLGNMLLDNPFRAMTEGKGVLCINLDSTGVIRPFIMSVKAPYIEGLLNNKMARDIFDREAVYNLAEPQNVGFVQQGKGQDEKARMLFVLNEEEYNRGRFALFHFPVVIFNEQINSIITKDFLSNAEKGVFAEHGVLYLNRVMEDLTSAVRDFGRHVVETLKPKGKGISPSVFWIILIVIIVILLVLFAPKLFPALSQAASGLQGAANNVAGAVQTAGS